MAKKPALRVVESMPEDALDDLFAYEDDENSEEQSENMNEFGIDVEDAVVELKSLIDDAVDFMQSEFYDDWERAEDFYSGETDVKKESGRSSATATLVRDAVRSIKPNAMRVFLQYPEICKYEAANKMDFAASAIAEAQTNYVNQLFWASGGYETLLANVHNNLLKRFGVMKAAREVVAKDEYFQLTHQSDVELQALEQLPEVTIISVEPQGSRPGADGVTDLYRVEVSYRNEMEQNRLSNVRMTEFFFSRSATSIDDCDVVGERRSVTVGTALGLGLDYDDWASLDDYEVEAEDGAGEAASRRGYTPDAREEIEGDLSNHRFLLTEAYASFDLDGTGRPQLYRFWLGGTNYELIDYDRVEENPYAVTTGDPLPDTIAGRSIMDVLDEDQNVQTSLLRATCDNAHAANNRRLAVHDTLVNMEDVLNTAIGAPIRFRAPGMIQEIGTQSTIGALLPLLQYLREQSEVKAGVTNASMGLDPDALQSTDKEAVRNTIQLAQGQIELFCRNIAETGLRRVFTKLLKLSLRNPPENQTVLIAGYPLPLHAAMFNPDIAMKVNIGLGTGDVASRIVALQMILQKQEQIIGQFGMTNPLCGIDKVMNTVIDIAHLHGVTNLGRYFSQISPELAQQLDEHAKAAAAAAQPEKPSAAVAIAEEIRGKASLAKQQMVNEQATKDAQSNTLSTILKEIMKDDRERDKMAQDLEVKQAEQLGGAIDKFAVEAAQTADRQYDLQKYLLDMANGREMQMEKLQQSQAQQRSAIPPSPMTEERMQRQAQQAQQPQQPPRQP